MSVDAVRTLREHDLQVTAQRLAVMRAVSARPHSAANELVDDVRRAIGAISRQSVYDTLALLTEREIIRRIQPAGSAARYEDRVGDNHHHLVCRSCDRLVDVECAVGEMPCLVPVDAAHFVVDEAEVTYWGFCPDCQPANREPPDATSPTPTPAAGTTSRATPTTDPDTEPEEYR